MSDLHKSVRMVAGRGGDTVDCLEDIDGTFQDESNINPFRELSSQHYQIKYLKEEFGLLVCLTYYFIVYSILQVLTV